MHTKSYMNHASAQFQTSSLGYMTSPKKCSLSSYKIRVELDGAQISDPIENDQNLPKISLDKKCEAYQTHIFVGLKISKQS